MNLLMITGDRALVAGKRGAFYNTLEELNKYFDRIDVICPRITNNRQHATSFWGNVHVHPSPVLLLFQPLYIAWQGWILSRQYRYSVMTVHEYPPFYNGIGAFVLHLLTRIPYMLEIHHIVGFPRAATWKEIIYRWAQYLFLRFDVLPAKVVRVVNRTQVPSFLVSARVPTAKIRFISSCYIDFSVFSPHDVPKEYDLLFIGRLAENKGVGLFLDAIQRLPGVRTLIVGDGPMAERLISMVKNKKLEDRIILHGWAKDSYEVAKLMNLSRVLVMPSYNEGGPRVVLEAMVCGVPVVATRVGIVLDVVPAELHCTWDPVDIASKCEQLLTDEIMYQHMQEHGHKIAYQFEKKTSIKAYADEILRIATDQS